MLIVILKAVMYITHQKCMTIFISQAVGERKWCCIEQGFLMTDFSCVYKAGYKHRLETVLQFPSQRPGSLA